MFATTRVVLAAADPLPACVVVAGLLALVGASRLGSSGMCVMCGGRGGHRSGCPKE